ncbi:MAG: hypothetical protein CEN90_298 [Parcubacteria group bacterium Licking1014_17]|nr:MAG: hypothetical protein CEN90_298 [Parcubacteria group bacterium Licking1014_17]
MSVTYFLLIFAASVMASLSQFLAKLGSQKLTSLFQPGNHILIRLVKTLGILFEPHLFFAIAIQGIVFFIWVKILTGTELSRSYPIFVSITVVTTMLISLLVLKEPPSYSKFLGMASIIIGIALLFSK